jgi:hypothetical protein
VIERLANDVERRRASGAERLLERLARLTLRASAPEAEEIGFAQLLAVQPANARTGETEGILIAAAAIENEQIRRRRLIARGSISARAGTRRAPRSFIQ